MKTILNKMKICREDCGSCDDRKAVPFDNTINYCGKYEQFTKDRKNKYFIIKKEIELK